MPKKKYFERDLINVNVWRNDHKRILELRRGKEPFYTTFTRIMDIYFTEKAELDYALKLQQDATISWKTKYEELLAEKQQKLIA